MPSSATTASYTSNTTHAPPHSPQGPAYSGVWSQRDHPRVTLLDAAHHHSHLPDCGGWLCANANSAICYVACMRYVLQYATQHSQLTCAPFRITRHHLAIIWRLLLTHRSKVNHTYTLHSYLHEPTLLLSRRQRGSPLASSFCPATTWRRGEQIYLFINVFID